MAEALVSEKDTCCLFINNGDDLLTLKKIVSKKTDNDGEIQKLNKSVDTNGSELNGNHNKTDSIIHFDVDNTSSLEPNFEMGNDTDRNITIGSICTQEDLESEIIYISNEDSNDADSNDADSNDADSNDADSNDADVNDADSNDADSNDADSNDADSNDADSNDADSNDADSNDADSNDADSNDADSNDADSNDADVNDADSNDADVNNGEKDIQVTSIKCLDVPYSQSGSLYDNDSHDLQDDYSELNNIGSPASYFNISARAPLHSYKDLDTMFEGDHFLLKKEVLNNERKRKFEDLAEKDQNSTKLLKLWNLMKYPFKKITYGTSISENKSNISKVEIISEKENTVEPESAVCENNGDHAKTEDKDTQNNIEADEEIGDTSINVNTQPICKIM